VKSKSQLEEVGGEWLERGTAGVTKLSDGRSDYYHHVDDATDE